MNERLKGLKHSLALFSYLMVVWGFYRVLFQFPDWIEEAFLKPIIWVVPTVWLVRREGLMWGDVGFVVRDFVKTSYLLILLGVLFVFEGLIFNFFKHGGFDFGVNLSFWEVLGVTLITAFVEEFVFRGYILSRVLVGTENGWVSNLMVSVGWTFLHLPVMIFVWRVDAVGLLASSFLIFMFSIAAGFMFIRTKSLFAPIVLHFLWQWPIILFR